MKKSVLLLLPFVLALHLPFCPLEYVPREWIRTYEFGKQWTVLLIRLYETAQTAGKEQHKSKQVPLTQIQPPLLSNEC